MPCNYDDVTLSNIDDYYILDLSNIPNAASCNEEPQTLEVKPLITPPQSDSRRGTWSSSDVPSESVPSTLNFPSQDEPVTMISKSISLLASSQPEQVH